MENSRTETDLIVQNTVDPECRAVHTTYEMSEGPEEGCRGGTEGLGEFGRLFLEIRGVVHVRVFPYLILVTKAPLFRWQDVLPHVEKIVVDFVESQKLLRREVGSMMLLEDPADTVTDGAGV